MLYRFREAQLAEMGLIKKDERRPYDPMSVQDLLDAERWRQDIIGEITNKIAKIQNS